MKELDQVVHVLDQGGIILYPTDTIWGIGCDATNAQAVDKVFEVKERPKDKPFILLVDCLDMLKKYVRNIHPRLETLLVYHQRPLTVIYNEAKNLPENALAPDGSVGIRIVQDLYCQRMIRSLGKPVVATSANRSNDPFPLNFGEISFDIMQKVDFIVNHRREEECEHDPSVIVKLSEKSELIFLRN